MATTHAQTMDALGRANEVRLARAELRRRVAAGEVIAAQVLVDVPDFMLGATVAELLRWQRRWGATRAAEFCEGLGLPETKTLGSMTLRQRWLLAGYMPDGTDACMALLLATLEEDEERAGLCQLLNGSGPCVRPAAHAGLCVVATFPSRAGRVTFREFSTRRVVAECEAVGAYGHASVPSLLELAALFAGVDDG